MNSPDSVARKVLNLNSPHAVPADGPGGRRVYAVGDIHGRLDLLQQLMDLIRHDAADSPSAPHIIFLGDYIDRGLDSRGVIEYLISHCATNYAINSDFLLGNHEQVMWRVLDEYDTDLAASWLRFGGREAVLSYGVKPPLVTTTGAVKTMIDDLRAAVPKTHTEFLATLKTHVTVGDYYFCHAGVRPGVALADQNAGDLLWIRADFMPHTEAYEKMIIHGHTITDGVDAQPNRIGIDTGAYATGCLTALALEGNKQWILQTNR